MLTHKLIFLSVSLVCLATAVKVNYDNYKVYGVIPKTNEQVKFLNDLQAEGNFKFWTDFVDIDKDVRIMVPPKVNSKFIHIMKVNGLGVSLKINNVQSLIDNQLMPAKNTTRSIQVAAGNFGWTHFHNLDEIYKWLDDLEEAYPNIVTTVIIGYTIEERPIKGIVIDFNRGNRGNRPLIGMVEGGLHAREWVSPATVTYIINQFLTSTDARVRSLAETFVWHMFPIMNPDGYVYSFSDNRLWRKNRNKAHATSCAAYNEDDDMSNGIDLNRNFDFQWGTVGVGWSPCHNMFPGAAPSSELETLAITRYVLKLKEEGDFIYYFDFHTFSQMVLVPYSHLVGGDVLEVDNYADLYEIAMRGTDKLTETHGTAYQVGTAASILYETSGASFDWVKGVAEVPIVYLFELRDQGIYGHLLPPELLIPNCEEVMNALLEMNKVTQQLGYFDNSAARASLFSFILIIVSTGYAIFVN